MRTILFCCLTLCLAVNAAFGNEGIGEYNPVISGGPRSRSNIEENPLLTEKYGFDFRISQDAEKERRDVESRAYFFEALRLYENNDVNRAIEKLEAAIETHRSFIHSAYFYHYGVCLMDKGEYANAEKAFFKALQFYDYNPPSGEQDRPLYTFDRNGAARERYFSYYNLACVYSLVNRLDLSLDYLIEALEYGYPYIDHLYADTDLANLLNSSGDIKRQIQNAYDNGFINKEVPFKNESALTERVKDLLLEYEKDNERFVEISFIQKANFNNPAGDSWIVFWKELSETRYRKYTNRLVVYTVTDKVENICHVGLGIMDPIDKSKFDIMKDIPGVHIPRTGLSIFDINKDGIDELIGYSFTGMGDIVEISTYDAGKNEMVNYCWERFEIIDSENGPAPLEFVNYKGRDGFKVYLRYTPYKKDILPPKNLINNAFGWYFCAWDDTANQYIAVEEFLTSEPEFNIKNYPVDFFRKQIESMLSNEGIWRMEEIPPRIEGGRSFSLTIYNGPNKTTHERIENFDSQGKRIRGK